MSNPGDLAIFTEETLYGKLHFLCSENYGKKSFKLNKNSHVAASLYDPGI